MCLHYIHIYILNSLNLPWHWTELHSRVVHLWRQWGCCSSFQRTSNILACSRMYYQQQVAHKWSRITMVDLVNWNFYKQVLCLYLHIHTYTLDTFKLILHNNQWSCDRTIVIVRLFSDYVLYLLCAGSYFLFIMNRERSNASIDKHKWMNRCSRKMRRRRRLTHGLV